MVLVEKASFSKEFRSEFHSDGGGYYDSKKNWNNNILKRNINIYTLIFSRVLGKNHFQKVLRRKSSFER